MAEVQVNKADGPQNRDRNRHCEERDPSPVLSRIEGPVIARLTESVEAIPGLRCSKAYGSGQAWLRIGLLRQGSAQALGARNDR
jgi:hypothetical protein